MATKRMLVDATHPEETRIVVTSGNRLEEFDFESASRRQLRGNIYLAKVTRVEPSLQAAFVDYGGNRHGFLAFSEIHPDYYQIPVADREALLAEEKQQNTVESEPVEATPAKDDAAEDDGDSDEDDGNGEGGHVEQAQSEDDTVEQVGSGDALEEVPERKRNLAKRYKIQEVIKRRQVMLVQVVKEERGNKGAALTTYLSLAGRYSVLMPNTARGGGISRKITNASDRKRLKEIAGNLEVPEGMGVILRTAGAARTKAEVKRDFEYLMRLWENVRNLTLKSSAPCLVYEEGSLIKRTIRDLYNKDIDEIFVAGDEAFREAKDFMRMIMPSHAKNVQAYKDDQPIFSKYKVESQLDSMFSPQVTLPSGGYIVINPTEALVSIDVNSGRATKEHNIEDTALQTNLEAAEEVSRQLRLRDLAGLIVIDFIDMVERKSNRNVERRLKDSLRHDRARIQVGRISHFGLMEMSRQRMRFGVLESSTHICPTCQGAGIVRSVESLALMVMRSIEDHVLRRPGNSINVRVPTEVGLYILNSKRGSLSDLESKYNLSITITADPKLMGNQFNIERGESRRNHQAATPTHVRVDSADMAEIEVEADADADVEAEEERSTETEEQSPRRRRRRGGRNRNRRDSEDNNASPATPATPAASEDEATADDNGEGETAPQAEAQDGDEEPRKRRRRGRRGGRRNRRNQPQDGESTEVSAENVEADGESTAAPQSEDKPVEAEPVAAAPEEAQAEVGNTPAEAENAPAEAESAPAEKTADATPAPAVAEAAPEEEKPVKKPRRTRRKKVPESEESAVAADAASTPSVQQTAEEPAAAKAEEPAKQETAKEEEPAEKPKKPKAKRAKKKDLPDEGIVVTSTSSAEDTASDGKPKKGGWWQRGFFG